VSLQKPPLSLFLKRLGSNEPNCSMRLLMRLRHEVMLLLRLEPAKLAYLQPDFKVNEAERQAN
jgi:hypothetical protein